MRPRHAIAAVFVATLFVVTVPLDAAAEQVSVRLARHDGYGRIVFNWPSPVPFTTAVSGNRLVVTFARPIEPVYPRSNTVLRNYIGPPRTGSDGQSVVIPLLKNFRIRSFSLGKAVIVDLLDTPETQRSAATATPPPAPQPPQPPASPPANEPVAPQIQVRAGEHSTFSRVVFDWPERVGYNVRRDGNSAVLTFRRAANIDTADINRRPPKYLRRIDANQRANSTEVALTLPAGVELRHFRAGSKVVVDISPPGKAARETADTSPSKRNDARPPAPVLPKPLTPETPAASQAEAPPAVTAEKTEAAAEISRTPASKAPVPSQKPVALKPPAKPEPAPQPPEKKAEPVGKVSLRFDWTEPVAAAAFNRAGKLWILFDKAKNVDLAKVREDGGNAVHDAVQIPADHATILQLTTVSGVNPVPRRDGFAWIFDLDKTPVAPAAQIETLSQPNSPAGARIFLPVPEAGRAIPLPDPEVGDNLVVVPVIPLGHGLPRTQDFVQFRLLPTAQGMVIKPKIDDLRVRPVAQGVELTSASEFQLSSLTPKAEADANISGGFHTLSRVIDPDLWRRGRREGVAEFNSTRQQLQLDIAAAKGDDARKVARYELARFYFGHGFAPETLAVLDQLAKKDPGALSEPQFLFLRGGANFLMHRFAEAEKDLGHPNLADNDEAAFWRALVHSASGDLVGAVPEIKRTESVFRSYPRALKMATGFQVVESAVAANDIKLGADFLEVLGKENPTSKEVDRLAYYEGALKKLAGDFDGAIAAWEEVARGNDRLSKARAALARAELLLGLKRTTPQETIEELEKLRFAWRGDEFEFDLLRKLGHLYLSIGDYRNGLRTLRQAVTYFSDNPHAPEVTQEMAAAFADLYLNDRADSLPPVTAIALYDEFKELTPSGEKGDEMIRKLADRLASVDLLDRAAVLLSRQVAFRLKGTEKARVGTQLALVHLLNREPKKALAALKDSEDGKIPDDLRVQRRHLNARALIDLGRQPEALALLDKDESVEADLLRTEIYWDAKDWSNAAHVLRRLVAAKGAHPGKPVNKTQANFVLNLAVALTLSGNQRGVARIRQEYGQAMGETQLRDAFNLVTSPNTVGLVDYRTIAGKVKEATDFGTFMAAYRERLKSGELSRVN